MTAPWQNVVCGFRQDFSVPQVGAVGLYLKPVSPPWARYRFVVQPLFGAVTEGVTPLGQAEMPSALGQTGPVDTGWEGNAIYWPLGQYINWFDTRGLPVPEQNPYGTYSLPRAVLFPAGATGIRVYGFVFFGPYDAFAVDLQFDVADASLVGALSFAGGGYGADTATPPNIYRPGWLPPYGQSVTTPGSIPLSTIASNIAMRGGLGASDTDVTALAPITVAGYPIARQSNAADCLLPLMQAYFGYASEYDAQLHFKFYGANAAVTIDRADLIEGNDSNKGAIVSNLRNQSTEFPRRIVGSYMDPAQNYTVVDVAAERRAVDVLAIGDQSFQIPVVMAADDAAKAVDRALKVAYATLEGTLEYSTPFAGTDVYLSLAAGEPLQFQGKRYVLDELILGNGSLKVTQRYDRQGAYTSNVQAVLGNAPVPPASPYSGPTTLIPMNLPAQRPQDTVGVYLAAGSSTGSPDWRGCNVQVSYDGMATWQNAMQITMESTIGTVGESATASSEPITVDLVKYDLDSATSAQLAAGANAFAVKSAAGVTQLMQFATAVETATPRQFQLTSVSRSLGGTVAAPLAAGDAFTLMDAAYFLPIDPSFAGRTLYFRGVGFGEVAEDATVYSLVYQALIATESAPFVTEDGTYQFTTESGTLALSAE